MVKKSPSPTQMKAGDYKLHKYITERLTETADVACPYANEVFLLILSQKLDKILSIFNLSDMQLL